MPYAPVTVCHRAVGGGEEVQLVSAYSRLADEDAFLDVDAIVVVRIDAHSKHRVGLSRRGRPLDQLDVAVSSSEVVRVCRSNTVVMRSRLPGEQWTNLQALCGLGRGHRRISESTEETIRLPLHAVRRVVVEIVFEYDGFTRRRRTRRRRRRWSRRRCRCRRGRSTTRFDSTYRLPGTDPAPPLIIKAEHIDDLIAVYKRRAEAARVLTVAEYFSIRKRPHSANAIGDLRPWRHACVIR